MQEYTISVGQSRTSRDWKNKATSWERLVGRLAKCKHTRETAAEYKAMTKTAQGKVKDVGGFVGGTVVGGARKADAIRAELLETGIVLKDTREGTVWSKA